MNSLKKTLLVITTLCVSAFLLAFLGSINTIKNLKNITTADTNSYTEDLSYTRKTYVSADNKGYPSTTNQELPFGSALTNISVGSTTFNGFYIERTSKNIPVIHIKKQKILLFMLILLTKQKGACFMNGQHLTGRIKKKKLE